MIFQSSNPVLILTWFTNIQVGFDEKVFEKAVAAARGGELSDRGTGRSAGRGTERSLLHARTPRDISNMIAALLVYNGLTVAEGFAEFDADGDGEISIEVRTNIFRSAHECSSSHLLPHSC
jgi:hypothetical protein